jgi:probable rRNA maturation factor
VVAAAARTVLRAEGVRRASVSVALVSDAAIRRLNARHLGHRRPTDVIAFTLTGPDGSTVGDVYIAPGVARAAAAELGIPAREEVLRLVVHGTLHVLGYDHPAGMARVRSAMWRRQEALLSRVLGVRA